MEKKEIGFFKGFFADGKGNPSSKRLCFILSNVAIIGVVIFSVFKFKDNPVVFENILTNFMIYSGVLGGAITVDVLERISSIIKTSKAKSKKKLEKNDK